MRAPPGSDSSPARRKKPHRPPPHPPWRVTPKPSPRGNKLTARGTRHGSTLRTDRKDLPHDYAQQGRCRFRHQGDPGRPGPERPGTAAGRARGPGRVAGDKRPGRSHVLARQDRGPDRARRAPVLVPLAGGQRAGVGLHARGSPRRVEGRRAAGRRAAGRRRRAGAYDCPRPFPALRGGRGRRGRRRVGPTRTSTTTKEASHDEATPIDARGRGRRWRVRGGPAYGPEVAGSAIRGGRAESAPRGPRGATAAGSVPAAPAAIPAAVPAAPAAVPAAAAAGAPGPGTVHARSAQPAQRPAPAGRADRRGIRRRQGQAARHLNPGHPARTQAQDRHRAGQPETGDPMSKAFKGTINVDIRDSVPDWAPFEPPKAPDGAPNVVYIVLDDVGFSAMSCYG